jgi:hypothetical protein
MERATIAFAAECVQSCSISECIAGPDNVCGCHISMALSGFGDNRLINAINMEVKAAAVNVDVSEGLIGRVANDCFVDISAAAIESFAAEDIDGE